MKCHQCSRPALYVLQEPKIPLCLDCWHKLQTIQHLQFLQNAAMMNQALDDMDAVVGFSVHRGRIPVAEMAKAMQGRSVYNNIRIDNSTVGVLNTGDLARIDAVITLTKDSDVEQIGEHLKQLTQALIDARDIDGSFKKELIDLVQSLAEQIVGSQGTRKPSVIMALLRAIEERAKGVAAIGAAVVALKASVTAIFGS